MKLEWFKISPNKIDLLPEESGIYIISVLLKNGEYGVIYVGQSTNIKQRVKVHFSDNESNDDLKAYFKNDYTFKISYSLASRDSLNGLEKYLISVFQPKFNNEDGNGEMLIECNLPYVVKY